MGKFEEISKMNLSELEAPEEIKKREAEAEEDLAAADSREEAGQEDAPDNSGEADSREAGAAGADALQQTPQTPGMANGDMLGMEDEDAAEGQTGDADAPKEKKPQKIMEPQGRHYTFRTEVSQQNLTAFLFGHTYRNPLIIVTTILAIVWPVIAIVKKQDNMYIPIICALFILL